MNLKMSLRSKLKQYRRAGRYQGLTRFAAFVNLHLKSVRALFLFPLLRKQLRQSLSVRNPDQIIELAFDNFYRVIRPIQIKSEIAQLIHRLAEKPPKRVLEIGTANGGTLFLFCRIADADAKIISVDLPGGWFGGGYPKWKQHLYHYFALPNQEIHLLRADSHTQKTYDKVVKLIDEEKLDLLFIDGDHTYEGAHTDFRKYSGLVRKGGLIVFHDIAPNPYDPSIGVPELWRDITRDYHSIELIENMDQRVGGIGIVGVTYAM